MASSVTAPAGAKEKPCNVYSSFIESFHRKIVLSEDPVFKNSLLF